MGKKKSKDRKQKAGGGTKRKKKNKPTSKKYSKYKIENNKIIREKTCPRCGAGVFLMKTNNRLYCGKCHYTEFIKSN